MSVILVIGSEGTIGNQLKKELIRRGHDICTADIKHGPNPNYSRCNISEYRQVEKLLNKRKYDFVYNLAAEFGRINGEDYYENLWLTNAIGLKNILRIQEKLGFKLIHFSSSEIYGEPGLKDKFISESLSETVPLKQKNDYAISKWVNELQIMNSIEKFNTKTLTVRLFNAYGPGEYYTPYRSVVCLFIYRALFDIPYDVYLNYHRVFMYVDDCIRTLVNIADKFKSGEVYNIGGEEYVEVKKVSDMILDYLGKNDKLVNYLPEDKHNTTDKRPDIRKAQKELGHECRVKLSEGIPKTIEWMKKVYNKN